MRPRLPSERTVSRVEAIVLQNVAPFVGVLGIIALGIADARNPFAWGAAGTLVTLRKLSKWRDEEPISIDPSPTDGSPPPADS